MDEAPSSTTVIEISTVLPELTRDLYSQECSVNTDQKQRGMEKRYLKRAQGRKEKIVKESCVQGYFCQKDGDVTK